MEVIEGLKGILYGYARVSTTDQNLATQIEKLLQFGIKEETIVKEKITGIAEDKELNVLIAKMEAGDTLVATRMDRLGRSAVQLLNLMELLEKRGIYLVLMDINLDTRTPMGKLIATIMAAIAEFDRSMIKAKQKDGIAIAKAGGKYKGRLKRYTDKHDGMNHAIELFQEGKKTVKEICKITNISKSALYRRLKELDKLIGSVRINEN